MMFQFLNGRVSNNRSTATNGSEDAENHWEREVCAQQEHALQTDGRCIDRMPGVSAQPPTRTCCVVRACAFFHEAQNTVVAAIGLSDEIDPELCERRDEALERVRGLAGRTKDAVQAKKLVLDVMRAWLSPDAPEIAAFAYEVATEAVILLDSDPAQTCSCLKTTGEEQLDQPPTSERRNPFSWFARPRAHARDTPFAN